MRGRDGRRQLERFTNWVKRSGKLPCMRFQHGSPKLPESAKWQFYHRPYGQKGEEHDT